MVVPIEYGFPIIGAIVLVCIGFLIYEHFKEKKKKQAENNTNIANNDTSVNT